MSDLETIGDLAIKVYLKEQERLIAKRKRGQEMFAHPCFTKVSENYNPCFSRYPIQDRQSLWCNNCRHNRVYHENYIRAAHQLSNLRGQLNKLIKKQVYWMPGEKIWI